jgi:hypothetical protein
MSMKFATVAVLTTALAVTPFAPANAAGWHHHGGHGFGLFDGLLIAGAAVTGAVVALATAPVRIIADAAAPPQPVYAQPAPVATYGGYPPAYYPQQRVVYAYPQPQPYATYPTYPTYPTYAYPPQ